MLFNSYIFVLAFFPMVLIGWFGLNHFEKYKAANLYMIGMSLVFYGYYNPSYLLVICISTVVNYCLAYFIGILERKKPVLILGIAGNIACIFYFKYYDFFISNINSVFHTDFMIRHIVLPLGISFFTFQQISYLVDSYRGETREYGFFEYILFVVFFPQLIAGPIVMHGEIIPQFRDKAKRRFQFENFNNGLYTFSMGLFKKVMIADTFGKAVGWGFGRVEALGSVEAIIVALSYTFQLYFDFSGYCDMAVGIGRMLNISLPQNFNSPYQAISIVDFWGRWHMSLTRFLRQYVYFPLGGSRKGKVRTYVNIMIVFLLSGIWHGANWTFILWGILHGVLNCLTRMFDKAWKKMHVVMQWLLTFTAVNMLWVLFRADSIREAGIFLMQIPRMKVLTISEKLVNCFELPELSFSVFDVLTDKIYGFWMWVFLFGAFWIVLNMKNSFQIKFRSTVGRGILTVVFMAWSIFSLAGISEFLYFGF